MSGYSDYSKSNNAIAAEKAGLLTASQLGKRLGVSATAIKATIRYTEWHHSSSRYNRVEYYDRPDLIAVAAGVAPDDFDGDDDDHAAAVETLAAIRAAATALKIPTTVQVGEFRWIEWGGTRKYPTATKCVEPWAVVTTKGQFYTIKPPFGLEFRKKIGATGVEFTPATINHAEQTTA